MFYAPIAKAEKALPANDDNVLQPGNSLSTKNDESHPIKAMSS